mmetsp:Transcript_23234/g.46344  ORF Transcript_23234/g.46344 Transcript_23234/m.46344 type:complete len:303 (+) Transcript_23234:212-1120(+)
MIFILLCHRNFRRQISPLPPKIILMSPPFALFTIAVVLGSFLLPVDSFSTSSPISIVSRPKSALTRCKSTRGSPSIDNSDETPKHNKKKGDSVRNATGIRPSIHPTTINCIAEALLLRAKGGKRGDDTVIDIDIGKKDVQPLQIAMNAGTIAFDAIEQRNTAAAMDETTDIFNPGEAQTISGRVVGVVTRMRDLEQTLIEKVNEANWVTKYGEEESFGVLKGECRFAKTGEESGNTAEEVEKELSEMLKLNPLLRMNRAECLLALFIASVEQPTLEKIGQTVSGGSMIDFVDYDRIEVLGVA